MCPEVPLRCRSYLAQISVPPYIRGVQGAPPIGVCLPATGWARQGMARLLGTPSLKPAQYVAMNGGRGANGGMVGHEGWQWAGLAPPLDRKSTRLNSSH